MMDKEIDLNLLQVLEAVLETGSVTEAGERLGRSQPSVSRSLAKLRAHYGDPLLVPQGRALMPTPFAQGLRASLGEAMASIRQVAASRLAFDPAADEARFAVALSDEVAPVLAASLIGQALSAGPGVLMELRRLALDPAHELLQGALDLAVGSGDLRADWEARGLVVQRLYADRLVIALAVDHPCAGGDPLSAEAVAALPRLEVAAPDQRPAALGQWGPVAARVEQLEPALRAVATTRLAIIRPSGCSTSSIWASRSGAPRCPRGPGRSPS